MKPFETFTELLTYCNNNACTLGEAALAYEMARGDITEAAVRDRVGSLFAQMKETIESGLLSEEPSMSGLSGGFSKRVIEFQQSDKAFLSPLEHKIMAYALATLEENSRMREIVACPTAGGSGSVPSCLVALAEEKNLSTETMEMALLASGIIGELVSKKMHLSGAAAGCQAEVGVATGMAAAGMVQALGGTPTQALNATSIAFKNVMGLICDPVAGLVEVPCVKRNAMGGVLASAAATMALAGIESFIPLDEIVEAMATVGRMMPHQLKESAEGGLAQTPKALEFTQQHHQSS